MRRSKIFLDIITNCRCERITLAREISKLLQQSERERKKEHNNISIIITLHVVGHIFAIQDSGDCVASFGIPEFFHLVNLSRFMVHINTITRVGNWHCQGESTTQCKEKDQTQHFGLSDLEGGEGLLAETYLPFDTMHVRTLLLAVFLACFVYGAPGRLHPAYVVPPAEDVAPSLYPGMLYLSTV
jgi:hypothetical protein